MKILFVSLGCDKNLVDSEVMLGLLGESGYTFTDDEAEAEIVIVNSCCFIGDAKEESINTILQMAELKKTGVCKALIVTGCLSQRYREEIKKEIPEVDVIHRALDGELAEGFCDLKRLPEVGTKRVLTTGGWYGYLKIAEGCNKNCSYCIIPKIRGPYRSVPMEELLAQAQELADKGVKELIVVAQETTLYGYDLYKEKKLPALLKELCKIEEIRWIRILYC